MGRSRTRARRASAEEFTALMEKYGLRTTEGSDIVAKWLYCKRKTVQSFYTRGILRTELDLLKIRMRDNRELRAREKSSRK